MSIGDAKVTYRSSSSDDGTDTVETGAFSFSIAPGLFREQDTITLNAVHANGQVRTVLKLSFVSECDALSAYTERFIPVKILSLGRTGTTYLMKLLSSHPEIAVNDFYNESNISSYYLQQISALYPLVRKTYFAEGGLANLKSIEAIQGNRLIEFPFITDGAWYYERFPRNLVAFAKKNIDDYYESVASPDATHFVEKGVVHDGTLDLLDKLYAQKKYVFLVRDFRDMYASMLSFNKKRGFRAFGMENYERDEEFIEAAGGYANHAFLDAYVALESVCCLVRYEDRVTETEKTLERVFGYLGASSDAGTIRRIQEATANSGVGHVTSASQAGSIGKYVQELDEKTINLLNDKFDKSLAHFGYS